MLASRFKINYKALLSSLYKINILLIAALLILVASLFVISTSSFAAGITLDTSIPTKDFNVPAGNLGKALATFSAQAGVVLVFDPILTDNKNSAGLQGKHGLVEGYSELLRGSGLEVTRDNKGDYSLKRSSKVVDDSKNLPEQISLKEIAVRSQRFYEIGPLPGLGLTKEEIPGNVQSITAKEIKEAHSLSITDLMNSKLQSVSVNDYQSNPFQMDVNYRGFTASPQLGTAQGISVFLDGIRVNEPFGDVVNWDMLPMNALKSLDIFPGSNPIFGLGTLGGALSMRTKSGFDGKTVDAEVLTGSFGRKQLLVSAGGNNGIVAGFLSGNFFLEDGWRDNSPSRVNQVFGKAEWRNDRLQLSLSGLYAGNKLVGNGLLPQQMVDQNPSQVYTSPDKTNNDLLQFQLSGIWDVSDTFNVTGQIYNRNSKRKSKSTDVNENFNRNATPNAAGKQVLYGYSDINKDGLPDYNTFAQNVAAGADGRALDVNGIAAGDPGFDINNLAIGTNFNSKAIGSGNVALANQDMIPANDGSGNLVPRWTLHPTVFDNSLRFNFSQPATALGVGEFNSPLPAAYYEQALDVFKNQAKYKNSGVTNTSPFLSGGAFAGADEFGSPVLAKFVYIVDLQNGALMQSFDNVFVDSNGFLNRLVVLDPVNDAIRSGNSEFCGPDNAASLCVRNSNGLYVNRDGAYLLGNSSDGLGKGSGVIEGTPTALITDTEINQIGKGGALQFNWNLDKHKLMVGSSVDMADATYNSAQYLGLLDAKRNGAAAPDQLGFEYYARDAEHAIRMNDFKGDSITKSIYASETWSATESLKISAAARFNWTSVKNKLDVNSLSKFIEAGLGSIVNEINPLTLCQGVDTDGDGLVDGTQCPTGIDATAVVPLNSNLFTLEKIPAEKFNFRSFNPSLGATWQANEALNLYGNWSRGARTPSVIELGCAYDDTLVDTGRFGSNGQPLFQERSIYDRRTCNLPSTMSGDPELKQVRSNSIEFGARGSITPNLRWNASVYKTDLTDDIYFVSVAPSRSFFQNIGDTKRQGLETGIKGEWGKATFGVNYSLTDATFQSDFSVASPYNSTAGNVEDDGRIEVVNGVEVSKATFGKIDVKKGNRIPGIPLQNLNFNFTYDFTSKWRIGLNAVMHSGAFVRGNENNKHQAGPATAVTKECLIIDTNGNATNGSCDVPRADWGPGTTPGYTVFNFRTSYKIDPQWTLGLQINNIFDKQYASAGRLGLNAFSPATFGAVGPSGFNYNSSEWQGTSFLGIGAPRSAFLTLSYEFVPDKN